MRTALHCRPGSETETPYGHRLRWSLPNGMPLFVHLKNNKLIANKKRWSQVRPLHTIFSMSSKIQARQA